MWRSLILSLLLLAGSAPAQVAPATSFATGWVVVPTREASS